MVLYTVSQKKTSPFYFCDIVARWRPILIICGSNMPQGNYLPQWVGKSSIPACMAGVRRGMFTCVGWQVTLCDPIWQVTSRSSEMGFPWRAISAFTFQRIRGYFYTEMCYINLRFTYLHTYLLTYSFLSVCRCWSWNCSFAVLCTY